MPHGPILVISGTNRPDSYALRIARVVEGHYRREGVKVELYSLAEMPAEVSRPRPTPRW
jgi:NAD(P)H-dependent FMN reductase